MRVLIFAVALASPALAADLCPAIPRFQTAKPGDLLWSSQRAEARPKKFCVANQLRAAAPTEVSWPAAGIETAVIHGDLRISECCFDAVSEAAADLRHGDPPVATQIRMQHAAEEGLSNHQEGFPDLIEEDARVRIASISGTLTAAGHDVRIDLILKCTASRFAKQYAYQYSLTDRSQDPVDIQWSLLTAMRSHGTPSVQNIPAGKTYIFLNDKGPREAEGRIEIRTREGVLAGVFRLDGFAVNQNIH